jgi:hypothetical protein
MHIKFWQGSLEERDYFEDLGVDGRIILKRILKNWNVEECTEFIWLRLGKRGDFFEHGNETSFSKNALNFLIG